MTTLQTMAKSNTAAPVAVPGAGSERAGCCTWALMSALRPDCLIASACRSLRVRLIPLPPPVCRLKQRKEKETIGMDPMPNFVAAGCGRRALTRHTHTQTNISASSAGSCPLSRVSALLGRQQGGAFARLSRRCNSQSYDTENGQNLFPLPPGPAAFSPP